MNEINEIDNFIKNIKLQKNSFRIQLDNKYNNVFITTKKHDNYKKWMNYIIWNGKIKECSPMRTSFYCPIDKLNDMKKVMIEHDYEENF